MLMGAVPADARRVCIWLRVLTLAPVVTGTLSLEELVTRLSDFGISDEDIESIFFKMDADHDGL